MSYTASGTGSRSAATLPHLRKLSLWNNLLGFLDDERPDYVMAGGAEGFDHALALAAHRLSIPYILALPHKNYANYYWTRNSVTGRDRTAEFNTMFNNAYRVEFVCDEVYVGGRHSNLIRNQYLVDHADTFAVYDPTSRGTADCVRRIELADKYYTVLSDDPTDLDI